MESWNGIFYSYSELKVLGTIRNHKPDRSGDIRSEIFTHLNTVLVELECNLHVGVIQDPSSVWSVF
jgi:hypothetical protein